MYIDILVQAHFLQTNYLFCDLYQFVLYGHTVFILFVEVLKNINFDFRNEFFFLNIDFLEVLKDSLMEPLRNQKR